MSVQTSMVTLHPTLLTRLGDRSNDMVLLVSFAGQEEDTSMQVTTQPRRVYAIAYLRHLPGSFQVLKVQAVPYQSVCAISDEFQPSVAHSSADF